MVEQNVALVTAASVAQVCAAIKAEGKEPSVRTVRARLGGGSPNDISPLLTDWKKGLRVIEAAPIKISNAIYESIADQIRTEIESAKREATEALAALESDVEELTQAGRSAESRAKALEAELEAANGQLMTLAGQIEQLKATADQIKAEAAVQIRTTEERATIAIKKAEEDANRERKDREATIASLGEAQARLEALPRLETENLRLQTALDAERKLRTDAERQVAATEAKAEGMSARLTDAQEQHRQDQSELQETRSSLKKMTEEAKTTAARIGELQGTIVTLEKLSAVAPVSARAQEPNAK